MSACHHEDRQVRQQNSTDALSYARAEKNEQNKILVLKIALRCNISKSKHMIKSIFSLFSLTNSSGEPCSKGSCTL